MLLQHQGEQASLGSKREAREAERLSGKLGQLGGRQGSSFFAFEAWSSWMDRSSPARRRLLLQTAAAASPSLRPPPGQVTPLVGAAREYAFRSLGKSFCCILHSHALLVGIKSIERLQCYTHDEHEKVGPWEGWEREEVMGLGR